MQVQIDMRVAELLASRLCHDLVGPVGAINNGLELLEEDDQEISGEAMELVADSARRAAAALQFYRYAFGMAGARMAGQLDEVRALAARHLANGTVSLEWSLPEPAPEAPADLAKLLLNLVLLGGESLPRGGALSVAVRAGPDGLEASVAASGPGAALREEARPALAAEAALEELTPRGVQAYFTRLLARRLGSDLRLDTSAPDRVRLSVAVPG